MKLTALYLSVFLSVPSMAYAQQPAAAPPPAGQPAQAPAGPKQPDYPDPRTLTVGLFYWITVPGSGPDIRGGKAATGYETLDSLGPDHRSPAIEVSYPITRTGVLKFEGFESKGDGNQSAPAATTVFATAFSQGDLLATQYNIKAGKLYLEDLLYPFKFPVAKFRVRSLWEVQYMGVSSTIDAPLLATSTSTTTGTGSRSIILPTFGLAAEYAIAPHVLLRAAASGFGLPHRAEIWDAEGTISYRHNKWEIVAGVKAFHFKTSPQKDEYIQGTLDGGFVGARWHF